MACDRKHVLITGTSSGIGRATMLAAIADGWHVFAGDRSADTADGPQTHVQLDVTKPEQIAAAYEVIAEHGAGLDGLANIAGVGVPGPLETMPLEKLKFSFEVDVFGQVALTQAMLPLLRSARGRIVFIGSIADRITVPFFGALAAAKSAIASINDTFRQELAPWGIEVVLVEPGFISTGADETTKKMMDQVVANFTPEQAELYGDSFAAATEAGYRVQTSGSSPEGVAAVILEALTVKHPKAHYLTGSKAHLAAFAARLPQHLQDELKRKGFHLPAPGSL